MKIPKPSEDDIARFRSLFEDRPDVVLKPMFGNLAAFVSDNQQMCAGLFGASIGLRLPQRQRAALLAEKGAGMFGPPERPMKEYATLPPNLSDGDAEAWIAKAIAHTGTLPAKKKRPKKA